MVSSELNPESYETDEDGLPREIVGAWVNDKHLRLQRYIGISRSVRMNFVGPGKAGATYIDLYSGPGRVRLEGETAATHGSPVLAWNESQIGGASFSRLHVADANPVLAAAVEARLRKVGASVECDIGPAAGTVERVVAKLNPHALHFAFLDPYNLRALPFGVLRRLAALKRMDMLVHVSMQDLNRNLRRYISQSSSPIDDFAPGWRDHVDVTLGDDGLIRGKILEHWRNLLRAEGMETTETHERVVGPKNQPLYWLAFAARHERALEFWEKIRNIDGARQLSLI